MGNLVPSSKKRAVGTSPSEYNRTLTAVKLYGDPASAVTSFIRFALLHKPLSLHFVPSEAPASVSGALVLQIGSEKVSGSRETLMRFIEARFPHPPLAVACEGFSHTTPWLVKMAALQHRSVIWHLERLVRWAEDLGARKGRKAVDPGMGSPRMEVEKFGKSYTRLLEMMLEHAQMEDRILFPLLEMADRGVCKAANEDHAKQLPIMNGIKEVIKSIIVLDLGSPVYQEAISNLSGRLKSLQNHCKKHFAAEEKDVLPLMEAVELSKEEKHEVFEQCMEVMQGTHSHLFRFFLEGLLPHESMQYLDVMITWCADKEQFAHLLHATVGEV